MADTREARALVLGAGGFLGQRIVGGRAGLVPVDIGRVISAVDLDRARDAVARSLDAHPGLPVLNCIGVRQGNATELTLLNGQLPGAVVEAAARCGAAVIHVGSAAEVLVPLRGADGAEADIPSQARAYADSKRAGSSAVASYAHGTVLRVYNLRGLPHQGHAGLHRMCLAIRAVIRGDPAPPLVDTVRDYVSLTEVVAAADAALEDPTPGVVDICSGVGIAMSGIAAHLPPDLRASIMAMLVPADLFAPVIGPPRGADPLVLAQSLSAEVLACASS